MQNLVIFANEKSTEMKQLENLKRRLRPGKVYRRSDLASWSNAIDRHLQLLLQEGTLVKLSQGLYFVPRKSAFGLTVPDDDSVIKAFLKTDDFVVISPNMYNALNVGTTQLYNQKVVYNKKRQGNFDFGGRNISFRKKDNFPKKVTKEFLLTDLLQNIDKIAEEQEVVYKKVTSEIRKTDNSKLLRTAVRYGSASVTRKIKTIINNNKDDVSSSAH